MKLNDYLKYERKKQKLILTKRSQLLKRKKDKISFLSYPIALKVSHYLNKIHYKIILILL